MFILPALIGFVVFYLIPTIRGFYFSMTQYNLLSNNPKWVGFANYQQIAKDPLFYNALWVTIEYVILNITLQTLLAVLIAAMMQRLTQSVALRGAMLLPWLISNVIAALVWFWLLDYQIGIVNQFMSSIGMNRTAFFADEFWAIPTIAFVNVWRHVGYTALLVFAGMQTIPKYVYEAAAIDGTTGWTVTDKNPWGTHYNYDKPEFQNTMTWMRSLIEKGYMPSVEAVTGQSSADTYGAGKYAMITNGSWMINQMNSYKGVETMTAPTPVGPSGKRSSMYNGLADSVWTGSKNKPAAIKWVEYLGSAACQDIVGKAGVVFPAVPSGTDAAEAAFKAKGIDVSSFTVQVKDGTTFLFPITDHASQITNIMQPAVDAVFTGKAKADSLTAANEQVNQLFVG